MSNAKAASDFFATMRFRGVWRDYQQRVLDEVSLHLSDNKLHVVAAPGSGKTVLGLEMMRQLSRPTIILSPTNTIRRQWIDRLTMFLENLDEEDDFISLDLQKPMPMTVATYQALHAVWRNVEGDLGCEMRPDFERMIASFNAVGPVTIIVDEAHHLRREWWRALFALCENLPSATLVALTATPPYDSEYSEWERYHQLCGPIDAEISVPELVRSGDLCPHQDYVHFSLPQQREMDLLDKRRQAIESIISIMLSNSRFMDHLAAHPWVNDPETYGEAVLERPEFLSAILVFLAASGRKLPRAPLTFLGTENDLIPLMSPRWIEALLNGVLFDECQYSGDISDMLHELHRQVHRLGLIRNQRACLSESDEIFSAMAGSLAKLDSIEEIARSEFSSLNDSLRMVILSDHVRASDLPIRVDSPFAPAKLGVIPIFESLRRANIEGAKLAVLTGTLVIIPDTAKAALHGAVAIAGIPDTAIGIGRLAGCPGYFKLVFEGTNGQKLVRLVTELFGSGHINILTGTQALLGEGWDAPSINSLVLASNVGSYMLSNQMRGRAIRIDPAARDKVSNIWHLATIQPGQQPIGDQIKATFSWQGDGETYLGPDIELLKRRFQMFEGVSNDSTNLIESGIERIAIPSTDWTAEMRQSANVLMLDWAADRGRVGTKWRSAFGDATVRSNVHRIAEANYAPRQASFSDTLRYFSISAVLAGATSAGGAMRQFEGLADIGMVVLAFGGLTMLYSLPKLGYAAWLLFRNGTIERSLDQVGNLLVETMASYNILSGAASHYLVEVAPSIRGRHGVILHNASHGEQRLFLDAMAEILGPIENPRYILRRKSWLGGLQRTDYHAVPSVLGARKEMAENFAAGWVKHIGSANLVYTRTQEGRKTLLEARVKSLSGGMQRSVNRRSRWR